MTRITVDTTLERSTEFIDEGEQLTFSTSTTPGVSVERVMVDGVRLADVPEELYNRIMDALYNEGYTT